MFLLAVPILYLSASLKANEAIGLHMAVTGLASLFLLGIVVISFLPETRGQALPE